MDSDPSKVTLAQLREALTCLNIEPDTNSLKRIVVEPGVITVTRNRVNENGRNFVVAYDRTGTETVEISVVNE